MTSPALRRWSIPALVAVLLLGLPTVARASTVVVHPNGANGWAADNQDLNGNPDLPQGTFVSGPGTPLFGLGSFRQQANTGDKQVVQTANHNGTPLTGIQLSFSTYSTDTAPTILTAAINMSVDHTGDGISDETLVFEPYEQTSFGGSQATATGVWQTWDADQGNWWSTAQGGPGGTRFTLADYLAQPGKSAAALATLSAASFRIVAGSTGLSWPDFDGSVDGVTINTTTYDFETFVQTIDCDAITNDIAAVQAAVDGVTNGSTVRLKGTCDFSGAAAHGGDTSSIVNTAVLIRSTSPINGLTVTSDGAPQSATVVGSGTQTAFTIGPDNDNVTIKGLRFVNLARPIVAINTDGTTIGAVGALPSPDANRIVGNATMDSGILGLAVDRNWTTGAASPGTIPINYGSPAASKTFTGQSAGTLTNFRVLGNYVSYDPPGTPTDRVDVAAIDVRQRGANLVDGVLVRGNVVGMFSSEFPSINMNGVKVHSFNNIAPSNPPVPTDYLIRNLEINGNNLGRLEEIASLSDDAADVHAAGRAGILVIGASNFNITGNGVRARLSPTGIPMPGGGIIVSDSGFGRISDSGIVVVADPSTLESDLGAIGVVDEINKAFGGGPKGQPSTRIEIEDNTIGAVGSDPPGIGSQRGLVVNGSSKVVAHDNVFKFTSDAAVNLAVVVKGPGSISSPGPFELPKTASSNVVCKNSLDGTVDDPSEVSFGAAGSVGNAFPGGGGFALNTDCVPALVLSRSTILSGQDLQASGKGWADRPLSVTITDAASPPHTLSAALTAGTDGSFGPITFTPAQLATLQNGTLTAVATASDPPSGLSIESLPRTATLNLDLTPPPAPTIVEPAEGSFQPEYVNVTGTAEPLSIVTIYEGASARASTTTDPAGRWARLIRFTPDGTHTIKARATDEAGNVGPFSAERTLSVDGRLPTVTITAPGDPVAVYGPGDPMIFTGTLADNVSARFVEVHFLLATGTPVAAYLAACTGCPGTSGTWILNVVNLPKGVYFARTYAFDGVGNRSLPAEVKVVRL